VKDLSRRQVSVRAGALMAWGIVGLLLAISAACAIAFVARAERSTALLADLAFHFDCRASAYPISEHAVEQFLQVRGFRVLNVVRARRERGMAPMLFELLIDGIDQQERMISFAAQSLTPGTYSVTLYTLPPTERATDLEEELLAFVSNTLKCEVRQVGRRENGPGAQQMYRDFLKNREDSFRRFEEWRRPRL
jgi:hypothetical protein